MKLKLTAVLAAGILAMSGCSGEATAESQDVTEEAPVETEGVSADYEPVSDESCFTVGEIGSQLSLDWDLVIGSRGDYDHPDYVEDIMDRGEDLYRDADTGDLPMCKGLPELTDFNYEVANLNMDLILEQETVEQYEKIADLGNELIAESDDEGYEWDYKFVTDVSEL